MRPKLLLTSRVYNTGVLSGCGVGLLVSAWMYYGRWNPATVIAAAALLGTGSAVAGYTLASGQPAGRGKRP